MYKSITYLSLSRVRIQPPCVYLVKVVEKNGRGLEQLRCEEMTVHALVII